MKSLRIWRGEGEKRRKRGDKVKCKLCGKEIEDDEIVDLGEERVICEKCFIDTTKQGIKELISGIEVGVLDLILEKLLEPSHESN